MESLTDNIHLLVPALLMVLFLLMPFLLAFEWKKTIPTIPFKIAVLLLISIGIVLLGSIGMPWPLNVGAPFVCPEGYQNLIATTFSYDCTGELGRIYIGDIFPQGFILCGVFWILSTILYFVLINIDRALRQKKTFEMGIVVSAVFWTFLVMAPGVLQPVSRPISDNVATSRYGAYFNGLHKAAAAVKGYNEQEKVRFFLDKGTNVNGLDLFGSAPLAKAVASGNIKMTRLLLERGADPNIKDGFGSPPLLNAVASGNTGIIKVLLRSGADLKARDKYGNSVLDRAGNQDIRRFLFRLGAGEGEPPEKIKLWEKGRDVSLVELGDSIYQNDLESVKLLLKAGVDVSKNESNYGKFNSNTLLIEAINRENPQMVAILLENGMDVNARSDGGYIVPLIKAFEKRNHRIVEILLKNGADVNAYDKSGNSALITAVKNGATKFVRLLLDKGADVNYRDNKDNTVLMYAKKRKNKKIVQLLESAGATE